MQQAPRRILVRIHRSGGDRICTGERQVRRGLVQQPALAHARLPDNNDAPGISGETLIQRFEELTMQVGTSHERNRGRS
ncbi:MAG: hypothetical protein AMS20_03245 [Gemmatimonas sp. SG8_28]|nr:MAG: hypothetical protein AMS20_03245 [Gemmatimonas sp. SG8_28]